MIIGIRLRGLLVHRSVCNMINYVLVVYFVYKTNRVKQVDVIVSRC